MSDVSLEAGRWKHDDNTARNKVEKTASPTMLRSDDIAPDGQDAVDDRHDYPYASDASNGWEPALANERADR